MLRRDCHGYKWHKVRRGTAAHVDLPAEAAPTFGFERPYRERVCQPPEDANDH